MLPHAHYIPFLAETRERKFFPFRKKRASRVPSQEAFRWEKNFGMKSEISSTISFKSITSRKEKERYKLIDLSRVKTKRLEKN